jgi:site-specific recombinase XerC
VYATQLDLRIIPKWGKKQLRELRAGPIEAWVGQLRRQGVGDPTIIKTLTVFRAILKRAERDEEIERNPIPLVAKPKQKTTARAEADPAVAGRAAARAAARARRVRAIAAAGSCRCATRGCG